LTGRADRQCRPRRSGDCALVERPLSRSLAAEVVTHSGRMVEREARALAGRLGVTA
jgi:hypothetical protein